MASPLHSTTKTASLSIWVTQLQVKTTTGAGRSSGYRMLPGICMRSACRIPEGRQNTSIAPLARQQVEEDRGRHDHASRFPRRISTLGDLMTLTCLVVACRQAMLNLSRFELE